MIAAVITGGFLGSIADLVMGGFSSAENLVVGTAPDERYRMPPAKTRGVSGGALARPDATTAMGRGMMREASPR